MHVRSNATSEGARRVQTAKRSQLGYFGATRVVEIMEFPRKAWCVVKDLEFREFCRLSG